MNNSSNAHKFSVWSLPAVFALSLTGFTLHAADVKKADNANDLNQATSWVSSAPSAADIAVWDNGVTTANSVLLGADVSWGGVKILDPGGTVTIGGPHTLTTGAFGIDMSSATQDLVITSNLTVLANTHQTWKVATGRTLQLNPGLFTRSAGATLNVQGAGTVATSSIANDPTGIIGSWASIGTGATTRYATVGAGNVIGLTGTAAATAADVTDTTGALNYDVAAAGTLGAGASFNTLRYTGAAGSISGAFTANGLMNVGGGQLSFSNGVTIGAANELVLNAANGGITLAGVVGNNGANASALTKTGSGTVTLGAVNTYTGVTVINEGTMKISASAATSSSATSALGDAAAGTVVASGATLDLNGQMLAKEVITINGAGVGGNGALVNTGGTQTNALSYMTLGSDASIGGTGRMDFRGNNPVINMNGFTLTKMGSNYVGLVGGSVTNAGHIVVAQGELDLAAGVNLGGNASNSITVRNGATLSVFGQSIAVAWTLNLDNGSLLEVESGSGTANTFSGPVNLGGVVTLDTQFDRSLTLTGNISDMLSPGRINKIGTGLVILSGTNSFTGGIQISGGIISLRNTSSQPATGSITVGASAGLALGVGGAGFYSASDVDSLWSNTLTGVVMDATSAVGIDTTAGNFTYSTSQSTRALTKLGVNTLTLMGVNRFTGATTINQGTLKIGVAGALYADNTKGNLVFESTNAGTLDLNGFDVSINGLVQTTNNTNSRVVNNASGTNSLLFLGHGDANAIFHGVIANNTTGTGTVTVTKTGSGTQTFRGVNTYTGGTTILRGTLLLDFANTANGVNTNLLSSAGTVTLGGRVRTQGQVGLTTVTPTFSMTGKASTTQSQTINGLTLNAASSVVQVTAHATANSIVLNLGDITRHPGGLVNFINPTGTLSATNGITTTSTVDGTTGILGGWAAVGGNDYATKNGNNIVAYSGYTALANGGTIASNTAGHLRVTTAAVNASTADGVTTDIATLSLGTGASGENIMTIGSAGTGSTGILRLGAQGGILIGSGTASGTSLTIGNVVGNGKLTAGGTDNTAGEIAIMNFGSGATNSVSIRSTIVDNGTGAVRLVLGQYSGGNAGFILGAANTYSGGTWLNSGRLRLDNAGGLGTGAVHVATGGQVWLNLNNATIANNFNIAGGGASLGNDTPVAIRLGNNNTLAGTITLEADAAIGGGSGTVSGVIQGDYQLTIGRAGTGGAATLIVTLTNENTYTGATNVTEGILQLGNGGTTGSIANSSSISLSSGATLKTHRSNNIALTQVISGAGSVEVANTTSGITLLSHADNSYTGTTTVVSGALQVGSGGTGSTGTGAVTVQNGGSIFGTGTVKGSSFIAQNGSKVYAGDSTASGTHGTLNFAPVTGSGSFTFESGSMVFLDVDSGGGCDKLVFTGTGSSDLSFTGTLTVGPTILTPTVERIFDLLDWSGLASTPSFGSQYTHTGLLYGNGDESPGLDLADVSGTGFAWDISNFTVDGTIALVAVPEPGRALLALLALACLAGRRRRKAGC
ncbi:beta strand repeat-containing protein [Verrucomicrobium spinosum]|uniref:beta strand repeat-containing protein n=1 Tax=Verrucomicrobium spinosum TaxID=2736 RepID=UPI0001746148|nr:autotransporter-associated beta strand repeat-containing protein [Verrucomicrobium spinosum]